MCPIYSKDFRDIGCWPCNQESAFSRYFSHDADPTGNVSSSQRSAEPLVRTTNRATHVPPFQGGGYCLGTCYLGLHPRLSYCGLSALRFAKLRAMNYPPRLRLAHLP